jgi:antitoxin component of MazEF toxin-antitoxin module
LEKTPEQKYLKIQEIGDSALGIVLPEKFVEKLNLQAGNVCLAILDGNEIRIRVTDDEADEVLQAFDNTVKNYDQVFKNLKKR